MSPVQRWLAACVWAAAIAGSALTAPDNRWFYSAFSGVVVGVVFARYCWSIGRTGRGRRPAMTVAAIVGLAGGIALFLANLSMESRCTATNASGQRTVIGTEFTELGRKYGAENPNDDKHAILEAVGGLGPELAWTPASIQRCQRMLILTGASWIPFFGVALTSAIALMAPPIDSRGKAHASSVRKKVFISYNHEDTAVAMSVRDLLARNNLDVIIDVDGMAAGQRIEEFIEQSIRQAEVVVSIVSNRSLLSAWVAMETIKSFHLQASMDGKLFIGCHLSDDHLRPEFRLECTRQIDERLQIIDRLIAEYAEKKIDPVDLNQEKTRLYELRNNLGSILARLKETLCLDLREPQFEKSCSFLVATINRR